MGIYSLSNSVLEEAESLDYDELDLFTSVAAFLAFFLGLSCIGCTFFILDCFKQHFAAQEMDTSNIIISK